MVSCWLKGATDAEIRDIQIEDGDGDGKRRENSIRTGKLISHPSLSKQSVNF